MNNTTNNEQNKNTKNILDNGLDCSSVLDNNSISDKANDTQDNNTSSNIVNINNNNGIKKNPVYNNLDMLTTEEARKRGRNGGKKSGEVRRQRKTMRESLLSMLEMQLSPEKMEEMGIDTSTLNGDYTMQGALISAMLREAVNGSEKAMQLVRDTIGEAPTIKQEITETITQEDATLMNDLKKALIS